LFSCLARLIDNKLAEQGYLKKPARFFLQSPYNMERQIAKIDRAGRDRLINPSSLPSMAITWRQIGLFICGLLLSLGLSFGLSPGSQFRGGDRLWAQDLPTTQTESEQSSILEIEFDPSNLSHLLRHGQIFHNHGEYRNAIQLWQSSLRSLNQAEQAIAHAHLANAYHELGEWPEANQQIQTSWQLINDPALSQGIDAAELTIAQAQILNMQGTLQLAQDKPEVALGTWQQAANRYGEQRDQLGSAIATINQAKALQAMGLYHRASDTLTQVQAFIDADLAQLTSQSAPDWHVSAILDRSGSVRIKLLLSLADGYRAVGNLTAAEKVLTQTWQQASSIDPFSSAAIDILPQIMFSLANIAQAQGEWEQAQSIYDQIAKLNQHQCYAEDGNEQYINSKNPDCLLALKAFLEQSAIQLRQGQPAAAVAILANIYAPLQALSANRTNVFMKVRWANQAIALIEQFPQAINPDLRNQTINVLAQALDQAQQLDDPKAIAYVLGNQAHLDEVEGNYAQAIDTTITALNLAQSSRAAEVTYQWAWQLGRLHHLTGDDENAIAAYGIAINALQKLRYDLVAISNDTKFSFRDRVEPVYRELVDLLVPLEATDSMASALKPKSHRRHEPQAQQDLIYARQIIEQLQIAELDNFFRQACLDAEFASIEAIDPKAAIVYPIITPSHLEVIVSIPNQPLFHYGTAVRPAEINQAINQMLASLHQKAFASERLPIAKKFYSWLIQPALAKLKASDTETLVMVLDGELRNMPMAALYDGTHKQYLIEQYNLVLNQGLKLLKGRSSLAGNNLRMVIAGISDAQAGFNELPAVDYELSQITQQVNSKSFINEGFTTDSLATAIADSDYPIVHLATHGRFSSNLKDTFILAWDQKINIDRLEQLLRPRQDSNRTPIELLVLSACETATGDRRATLGLAGVALRSGARSTLASLWTVADRSTAELMVRFYDELGKPNTTKAAALRQAQLSLLRGEYGADYKHPYYWAAFVLAGNWL
jgi:CHAT domain-containing protein